MYVYAHRLRDGFARSLMRNWARALAKQSAPLLHIFRSASLTVCTESGRARIAQLAALAADVGMDADTLWKETEKWVALVKSNAIAAPELSQEQRLLKLWTLGQRDVPRASGSELSAFEKALYFEEELRSGSGAVVRASAKCRKEALHIAAVLHWSAYDLEQWTSSAAADAARQSLTQLSATTARHALIFEYTRRKQAQDARTKCAISPQSICETTDSFSTREATLRATKNWKDGLKLDLLWRLAGNPVAEALTVDEITSLNVPIAPAAGQPAISFDSRGLHPLYRQYYQAVHDLARTNESLNGLLLEQAQRCYNYYSFYIDRIDKHIVGLRAQLAESPPTESDPAADLSPELAAAADADAPASPLPAPSAEPDAPPNAEAAPAAAAEAAPSPPSSPPSTALRQRIVKWAAAQERADAELFVLQSHLDRYSALRKEACRLFCGGVNMVSSDGVISARAIDGFAAWLASLPGQQAPAVQDAVNIPEEESVGAVDDAEMETEDPDSEDEAAPPPLPAPPPPPPPPAQLGPNDPRLQAAVHDALHHQAAFPERVDYDALPPGAAATFGYDYGDI